MNQIQINKSIESRSGKLSIFHTQSNHVGDVTIPAVETMAKFHKKKCRDEDELAVENRNLSRNEQFLVINRK